MQVRPWLDVVNQLQASLTVQIQSTSFDQCVVSDQVRFDGGVWLHFFEVRVGQFEVVCSHTRVDHAVIQDFIWFVGYFDFVEEFGDDAELLALFFGDHPLDEGWVGEVVSFYVFVLHILVTVPGFPKLLAAHLAVNDRVVTHSTWSNTWLAHYFNYNFNFLNHFIFGTTIK